MGIKFLSPEEACRLLRLAESSYRPKEILDLKERIKGETRAAELNVSVTGVIDPVRIEEIVEMKLCLDGLCCDWAQGKLS